MTSNDSKKLDQIIAMIGDVVGIFGKRFDQLGEDVAAVKNKVDGINRRLDAEAMQRTDMKLPRRLHDLEEEVYGPGRSKHPKHLPL